MMSDMNRISLHIKDLDGGRGVVFVERVDLSV